MQKQIILPMESGKYPFGQLNSHPASPPSAKEMGQKIKTKTLVRKIYRLKSVEDRSKLLIKINMLRRVQLDALMKLESVLELQQENQIHVLLEYVPISFIKYMEEFSCDFIENTLLEQLRILGTELATHSLKGDIWSASNIGLTEVYHLKYFIDFDNLEISHKENTKTLVKQHYEGIQKMLSPFLPKKIPNITPEKKKEALLNPSALGNQFTEFRKSYSIPSNSSQGRSLEVSQQHLKSQIPLPSMLKEKEKQKYSNKDEIGLSESKKDTLKASSQKKHTKIPKQKKIQKQPQKIIKGNWDENNYFTIPEDKNERAQTSKLQIPKNILGLDEHEQSKSIIISHEDKSSPAVITKLENSFEEIIWEKNDLKKSNSVLGPESSQEHQSWNLEMIRSRAVEAIKRSKKAIQIFRQTHKPT